MCKKIVLKGEINKIFHGLLLIRIRVGRQTTEQCVSDDGPRSCSSRTSSEVSKVNHQIKDCPMSMDRGLVAVQTSSHISQRIYVLEVTIITSSNASWHQLLCIETLSTPEQSPSETTLTK